jgi:hypothetical protein
MGAGCKRWETNLTDTVHAVFFPYFSPNYTAKKKQEDTIQSMMLAQATILVTSFRVCPVQILAGTMMIVTAFSWLSAISPDAWMVPHIRPQLLYSPPFPINYSSTILALKII